MSELGVGPVVAGRDPRPLVQVEYDDESGECQKSGERHARSMQDEPCLFAEELLLEQAFVERSRETQRGEEQPRNHHQCACIEQKEKKREESIENSDRCSLAKVENVRATNRALFSSRRTRPRCRRRPSMTRRQLFHSPTYRHESLRRLFSCR